MDILWILFAFVCGMGVKALALPPLIGFLAAGFLLNAVGAEPHATLDALANLGITLLLFTIGLKLNVKDLLKREVWMGTLSHMGLWTLLCAGLVTLLGVLALALFTGLDPGTAALIGFALSFSSTVCIIKILEESGELSTRHGKLCIGVLVMQDIAAVVFLVAATDKAPTAWALGLPLLYFARPLLGRALQLAGHGEMLPLTGFMLALGGYELFDLVGVKGDLGALACGMLVSAHPKANELSRALLGFKDLFLIGFFLSIGLTALPDLGMLLAALGLCLLLPFKFALFFFIFAGLRLRARTAFLGALALGNYSEFGLIVGAVAVEAGWLPKEWLVVMALVVSLSFVFTSVLYRGAHSAYAGLKERLHRFESPRRLAADILDRPRTAEIIVVGTGRVGRGAFKALHDMVGDRVWGMDADRERVRQQREQGMHVFAGDGENADLWEIVDVSTIKLVLLAVPSIEDCRNITQQLRRAGYQGRIAAIARYEDDREALLAAGIDRVFNFFAEAGLGFAEDSLRLIGDPAAPPPAGAEAAQATVAGGP